ncbi:MAG TPA: hypothetical protein PKY82_01365 [Pyrinomonadaceae bacterium]|nr:hypothetical protein [Pyrinomonadaceae bacterium]
MKYNKSFSGEPFEDYKRYLETIKDKLPQSLYNFVSNSKRHNLEEQSLHDSWINEIKISVVRDTENRNKTKSVFIKIELLGPYHDRIFEINFNNVCSYQIGSGEIQDCDLISYEIYLENLTGKDIIVFYTEFADKSSIIIKAQNIEIIEKVL